MGSNRITMFVILVAIGIGIWMPSARADSGLLVVGGGATEHARATIGGAIERAVRSAGWSLPKPATKKEADGLLNCQDEKAPWTCVPPTISAKGIRNIFVVSVDATSAANGAPLVVITGRLIATDPPEFAYVQRFCEHCADDKLIEAGTDLARQLFQDIATQAGRTVVHFTSAPSTAEIILDGTKLGTTEATYSTYPGKHVAVVQKPGYISQVKEFEVEEGKTAELYFELKPSEVAPTTHQAPKRSPRSYLLPGVAIGAGLSFALLGGALLYQGLRNSDPYEYPRATAIGVPISLVGLGAISTGVYLLWRGTDGVAASASGASKGVVLGWSGSF